MLFTTMAQWVVLLLILVGGWLLGLASHPGGRRWRERYATERDAHAVTRRDADAHRAEVTARVVAPEPDPRLAEAHARIADLERDHARLTAAAPVTAATVTPMAGRPEAIAPVTRPTAAYPVRVTPETDGTSRTI